MLLMEKRNTLLKTLYELHSKLIDVFHSPASDNQLLAEFCRNFIDLVKMMKPMVSHNHIDCVLKPFPDFTNKSVLASHLLVAADYSDILIKRIESDLSIKIENETIAVIFDYARLLQSVEKMYSLSIGTFVGSRNMKVDAYSSFKIATQFFWSAREIQRSNTLNGYTIFGLRQSIELAAKELLGITAITDKEGRPDFYASQIPWKFIVENQTKHYFNLPFQSGQVQKVYQWSNRFVHTGNDALCYVTAMALTIVGEIFQNQKVTYWEGTTDWVSKNEIKNYSALKKDFEEYLANLRTPKFAKWASSPTLAYVSG
jgi:hypothetical protein